MCFVARGLLLQDYKELDHSNEEGRTGLENQIAACRFEMGALEYKLILSVCCWPKISFPAYINHILNIPYLSYLV